MARVAPVATLADWTRAKIKKRHRYLYAEIESKDGEDFSCMENDFILSEIPEE